MDVAYDGRQNSRNRDPPGQKSVYIPPGDPERETYRLSTYKNFPQNIQVDLCLLAACGFYYTGFKDRVKCFSCGIECDSWNYVSNVTLRYWHEPDCDFINGRDTRNVLISEYTARFSRVQSTSGHPTTSRAAQQNVAAPQSRSSASFQPPRSTPPPSVAAASRIAEAPRSSPVSLQENTTSSRPVDPSQLSLYPCRDPINPHMRNIKARLQTFIDRSNVWPSHRIRATPEEIADAGMYCLGERDRAKCWYCNGGLQNWSFDDDPWVEHAKWFPMCEYLLQRKGSEFVHAIIVQFPHLNRPMLYNPSTAATAKHLSSLIENKSRVYHSPPPLRKVPAPIPIVDPQEEMRKERLSTQRSTPELAPIEIVDSEEELEETRRPTNTRDCRSLYL